MLYLHYEELSERKNMEKIDIVYTWVNHTDEKWQAKYLANRHLSSETEAVGEWRFNNNDELKYSLRSQEKFAPWINHVYIVTDNQIPDWLNTENPKITIIDHKDIIPNELLPVFNSNVIEMCISRIPDLAEYFLYANDDTYFGRPVKPDFFFTARGKLICRFHGKLNQKSDSLWEQSLNSTVEYLKQHNYRCSYLIPHHNIDSYRKSVLDDCLQIFKAEIEPTLHNKFRTPQDVERNIFALYALATQRGVCKKVHRLAKNKPLYKKIWHYLLKGRPNDSACFNYSLPHIEEDLLKYNPALFCINDNRFTTDENRKNIKNLLEKLFPHKSKYEK